MSTVKLVIIGHIAFNQDITRHGVKTSEGGSCYYAAAGAIAAGRTDIGLVSNIGFDFPLKKLIGMQVNLDGVTISKALPTAKFVIDQITSSERSFSAEWGAALEGKYELPLSYKNAEIVHLATAPPEEQIRWIQYLRVHSPESMISIDCFEHFVKHNRHSTLEAILLADFIFLNIEEWRLLDTSIVELSHKDQVLKAGPEGATIYWKGQQYHVPALQVEAIDTTGAGDVLAGAFLSLFSTGHVVQALQHAAHIASLSVTQFGVDHLLKQKKYEKRFVTF